MPRITAHPVDTTPGDTFGGMGTSEEVREEELLTRMREPAMVLAVPTPTGKDAP